MEKYADTPVKVDGIKLFPIVKLYKLDSEEQVMSTEQKVIF